MIPLPAPVSSWQSSAGKLHLPVYYDTLKTLGQTVNVDYMLPGCPPESDRIWDAIVAILENKLPKPGSIIGSDTTVCDDCPRKREEKKIKKFYRTWEIEPNMDDCLLEQGLLCAGIATRAGCGALCPQVNSPCIGCYGPNDGVEDYGMQLLSAVASVIDSDDPDEINAIIATHARTDCMVTTNTSGIGINQMAESQTDGFRRNYALSHFFNPVKVMKLVELVPGAATTADVRTAKKVPGTWIVMFHFAPHHGRAESR